MNWVLTSNGCHGGSQWRCRSCAAEKKQFRRQKQLKVRCPKCGGKVAPGLGVGCAACKRTAYIANGEKLLRERHPEYAELVLSILSEPARSDLLHRISRTTRPGSDWRLPSPDELFPTIRAGVAERLVRARHHINIDLCRRLSSVPWADQLEFYDRYLTDPDRATCWARLPRWQRPIMAGDADDQMIWKLFTMIRLRMAGSVNLHPATLPGLGRGLVQEIGFWEGIKDRPRAYQVFSTYGAMLAHGEDVGDVVTPPWKVTK